MRSHRQQLWIGVENKEPCTRQMCRCMLCTFPSYSAHGNFQTRPERHPTQLHTRCEEQMLSSHRLAEYRWQCGLREDIKTAVDATVSRSIAALLARLMCLALQWGCNGCRCALDHPVDIQSLGCSSATFLADLLASVLAR